MNKEAIIEKLLKSYHTFWNEAKAISPEMFHQQLNGKWSAAQNVEHINKGLRPTAKYFSLPKTEIESRFGFINHPSGNGDELISFYKEQLAKGTQAPERMIPGDVMESADALIANGQASLDVLVHDLARWSEEELDKYVCPHTVLGKLTPREMLYFIIAHVEHHQKAIVKIANSY